jgi:Na+/melibiose symporter-like transporter
VSEFPADSGIGRLQRLLYSSGIVSYALKDAAFGVFVLFYYKQLLGLSGTLTGIAIAISILWDAISDPLVGAWSDRCRSRWGRRHPFMLASVVPMAASFICLFWPPEGAQESTSALFLWLLFSVIALRTSLTFFMVPYLALGAELSSDYHERTRLSSVRTNVGWFIGVLVPTVSLMLVFADGPAGDGRFIESNYQLYGFLSAAGVVLFCAICIRGTWSYIGSLPVLEQGSGPGFWANLRSAFSNMDFRRLVILDTAIGGMAGVLGALLMVTYTYFWQLSTAQISLLFGGPPMLAVLLVSLGSNALNNRFEQQEILRFSCVVIALNLFWLTPLHLFGLLPKNADLIFLLVFLNYGIHVSMVILRTVENYSLLADVVDEQELACG